MRTMPIREFLRGGYQNLVEGTVVTRHGHTVFTVFPSQDTISRKAAEMAGGGLKSAADLVQTVEIARPRRRRL